MNILNHEKPCSWNTINWKSIRFRVFKWQRKIYIASKENNIVRVRTLQNRILESRDAKLLVVRKVTQDKTGRKTAGVDGIKSLNLKERLELVSLLKFPTKSKPVRGIPRIKDRCLQALFKLALEPEWEAKFEPNSYSFRPGRNAHNAIVAIQSCIQKRSKFVLEADISNCFDKINHNALLKIIGFKGKYRKQLEYWLEAGVLDSGSFECLSPILANIALHGLENHLKQCITEIPLYYSSGRKVRPGTAHETVDMIRYGDNFVVLNYDLNVIIHCKNETRNFLSKRGLELSEKKIRITHTLEINDIESKLIEFDGKIGFNFLGFTIKQYKTKHKSAYNNKNKLYYKTLIYPSTDSINKHQKKLHNIILKEGKLLDQDKFIDILNPVIRGWAIYFGISNDLKTQDYLVYLKLRKWSSRIKGTTGGSKWKFGQTNKKLLKHTDY
jgi:RNA-directed DNA polymerase